jgi:hypothetical protein
MTITPFHPDRRSLITSIAGMTLMSQIAATTTAAAETTTPANPNPGKPGEFDFLTGEWRIHNRMIVADKWIEFPGEATVHRILNGIGSVEELRVPARKFSGMGLRLLDLERHVWSDFWVSGKNGILATPGQEGSFKNGVGTFTSEDMDGETKVIYRGVWDRITPKSCRWFQGSSRDGGKTWVDTWFMDWRRVG